MRVVREPPTASPRTPFSIQKQEEHTAVLKKTTGKTRHRDSATTSDLTEEAVGGIAEARQQNSSMLDLSGLRLTELPATLSELHQLRSLDLSDNRLLEVPAALGELRKLQALHLSRNQLQK